MAANIQSLTALRGFAALAVLTYHCAERLFGSFERVPLLLRHGYLAVDLFFLLSGFVLMHVHEQEFGDGVAWTNFKSFIRARFARTYPIHFLMLMLLLPLYGSRPEFSAEALVQSLLLIQAPWLGHVCWNVPAWSVSAEWHAYFLFPFLVMPWRRRSIRVATFIFLLCLITLSLVVLASGNSAANIYYTPGVLLRSLPEFIAGMGLYRVYREGWLARWMTGDRAVTAVAIVVVGLASFSGTDIAVIVALAFLLLACAHNKNFVARLLATRMPMFLGRISYSLYMVQTIASIAALFIAQPWHGSSLATTDAVEAVAMFALSFALAAPLSRYIEYPMRDWLRGRSRAAPLASRSAATITGE